jgi:hypothetical protein
MADENYRSNRTGEAFARAAQPAYPGYATPARSDHPTAPGDPLAELARLIGQNDPFADFGRAPAPRESYAAAEAPTPQAYHPPSPAYASEPAYPSSPALSPAYATASEPHYADRYDQTAFDDQNAALGHAYQPVHAGTGYDTQGYATPGHVGADDAAGTYQPDPFYGSERAMPAASDDMYEEDAPPPRRRGGLGIVAGILALALVGTGAAYGYRTLFSGSSGSSAPPPVIKADGTPNKVVPAQSADGQTSKMITDRVGEPGQGERVVSREEKPVDIKDASRPGQPPRVIFPGPVPNQGSQSPGTSTLASAPSSPSAWAEPKKVRTEVIRADRPIAPETNAQPNTRSADPARPAPRAAAPAPSDNGPLSLAPQSGQVNGQQQPARTRTAAAPAAPSAAPAAATSASGAYAVQISSQRSEAEAQASFRALQTKYPSVLGGQSPVIRRADLGDKGIYFRALVGPYATAEQATTLCVNLKAAGGQCVVQRN